MKQSTKKNKIYALILIIIGIIPIFIEKDATPLIFFLFFAVPLFFAKKNVIDD